MAREQPIELFMPPNLLKAKVGAGGFSPAAIARAETAMATLKDNFESWMQADVRRLDVAHGLYAEKSDARTLRDLLRAAHDLKGQAGTFDYPLIARVAGSLCNLIQDLAPGRELSRALVDAHVNAIQAIYRDGAVEATTDVALALAVELETRVAQALG
ncbi:MAG: Hpt domain-containing protein [Rhizomicrobium sp.]